MGKKQKGGRRQILQLEDKKPPRSSSKNRIKNLIHYSDSDEDSKKSNDSEHSSTVVNKEGCPLDSQVADFFKEIDALTVNEESADATENSVVVVNDSGKEITFNGLECKNLNTDEKLLKKSNATESDGKIESYCPWQEIPDDSTGYSYYWNVETNEVTWDCPDEYAAYISAISSANADSQIAQNEEIESLKKLQRKKESQLIEGAIIPISYFGDSSSDESEDSQNGCSKLLSKVKKDEKCSTNKGKSSKIGLIKSEQDKINLPSDLIGPQLPPEYRFNEEVPIIEEKLEQSLNLKSDVCDLVESRTIDLSNMSVQNMTFSESEKTSDASFKTCSISSSQSNLNIGVVLPPMSKDCEDFEIRKESISNTENGEIPDSTEKQGDVLTSTGLGLVEYNSFTDDEEEIGSSNLSPINHNTGSNDMLPDPTFQVCHDDKSIENKKMEVTESVIELNDTIIHNKRKNIEEPNEKIQDSLIRKTKKSKSCNAVDIDSMFASHLSNQKHGFGFVKQNTELVESDSSCSDHNQDYSTNRRNDYKSVSFVKSEHVLDLSEINSGMISDELDPLLTNADLKLNNECSKNSLVEKSNEHDFIDTEHFIKEQVYNKKENTVNSTVIKNLSDCESKVLDHEIVSTDTTLHNELALLEEDIDEIDKALCEALVAKKRLENKSGNTLSSPSKIKLASTSKKIGPPMTTPELKDMAVCCVEDSERDDTDEDDIPALGNDKISALDLSSCLVDKLTFLISNDSSLSSLSALLVQLQTRLVDWQAAALENKYFMARLQEVNQYICQYEMGIVSGDWICQWDRENKRYYYVNSRTQHSQWTYPDDQSFDLKTSLTQSQMEVTTSSASSCISEQDENQTVTSSSPANLTLKKKLRSCKTDKGSQSKSSSKKSRKSSPPPPPPGVDSPPPPPPCSPPPHSPPPPPPDSTEVTSDLTEDMDLENSNDSCSPLIISNSSIYEVNRIQASPKLVCSSNSSIKTCGKVRRTNIVTSTLRTENESSNIISTSHQASVSHSDINSNTCVLWSAPRPSCSSEIIKHSEAQNSTTSSRSIVTSQASDNVCDPCLSSSSVTYSSSTDDVPNKASTSSGTALKKEKKKMKLLSVLALKKKNIPSLVEKWQKIKEEQEKEDISGNS